MLLVPVRLRQSAQAMYAPVAAASDSIQFAMQPLRPVAQATARQPGHLPTLHFR